MAIYVPDMPCGLCGKAITIEEEKIILPPFVPNKEDAVFAFSDGVFHHRCFEAHPLKAKVERLADWAATARAVELRRCVVCGDAILDPDDYFPTGLLTSDEDSPAFPFNFLHLHRTHFCNWEQRDEFRSAVRGLQGRDVWCGPRIVFDPGPRWEG